MRQWFPKRPVAAFFLVAMLVAVGAEVVRAAEANVFVYHRFGDERHPSTNVSLEVFRAQLEMLREGDYRVLPLGEVVEHLRAGRDLPPRTLVLTIDDAYESFATGGFPLLREFGYPATLFVATDSVGRPGYLDWDQLRQMHEQGIEIGNHSAAHLHMAAPAVDEEPSAWRERMREDLERSQQAFQRHLGFAPKLFAYPYGEYSRALVELVRELGFEAAAAQHSGVVSSHSDLFALPRFPMGGVFATEDGFRDKVRMKALPVLAAQPDDPILVGENPPWLTLRIDPEGAADYTRLNFFVRGQAQSDIVLDPATPGLVRVRADEPLSARRTSYTLTAPGKDGRWHWYSFVWIRPEVPE
ncbi:polysaccharide deacetylase family protein [Geoalkalibacter halelectricus]|uniref:Polysaccharide deacetylase family protein n=1 Tax=Geoalkalibacter halelectricus TaxID=2847045 RepID=A0ABY5ZKJ4_9BACT|nr:polysaccharide deacetylase family protein [Geoalkalibacter halelectricus]MDO3376601.1 polysaccharide deacetylase family protein [Geoalkalibacter halelectricus]UWZ78440.1 polysaccharide deacetylase family protein [Geoalkalibacter halelectricus]